MPQQKYIHFTSLADAKKIKASGELWASSIVSGVYAVAVGGSNTPGTQRGNLGVPKNRNFAVLFTTNILPDLAYPEECIWHREKLPIVVKRILKADDAARLLDGSIPIKDEGHWTERLMIPSKENLSSEEMVEESLEEAIPEPKRKNAPDTVALGITKNGGYENIMKVLRSATQAEVDYWGFWYHNAKNDVNELAEKYGVPFKVMAGVVAVLSPGNRWHMNLMAAEKVLQNAPKINSYPANIAKARGILETGNLSLVTGPKVTVFFKSLLDPVSVEEDLVLDGHAINIWRGAKEPLGGLRMPTKPERAAMVDDYKRAAKDFGVPVQAVQSVTWYIWKYTTDPPKPVQMKINLVAEGWFSRKRKKPEPPKEPTLRYPLTYDLVPEVFIEPDNVPITIPAGVPVTIIRWLNNRDIEIEIVGGTANDKHQKFSVSREMIKDLPPEPEKEPPTPKPPAQGPFRESWFSSMEVKEPKLKGPVRITGSKMGVTYYADPETPMRFIGWANDHEIVAEWEFPAAGWVKATVPSRLVSNLPPYEPEQDRANPSAKGPYR